MLASPWRERVEGAVARSEAREREMKMESGMMVAEGLWGDARRISRTNINKETFTSSVLLLMMPLSVN